MRTMLTPLRLLTLFAALCATALVPSAASAARSYPKVTSVSPKKLGIGDTMTITGAGFRKGKNKNTVVFKRDGRRGIFVKAPSATTTRITLTIPPKLLTALAQKKGKAQYTRFRIRVMAAKLGKAYTSKSRSPLIGPTATATGAANDCDGDKILNTVDTDDDNDLLEDVEEATLGLKSCSRDSDEDGLSDGWEMFSAQDRNSRAIPSPKKKPYPNALDPSDGKGKDHDGDGMSNLEEYILFATFHPNWTPNGYKSMPYSGGDPKSIAKQGCLATTLPKDCSPERTPASQLYMDRDLNGYLSDFEQDGDGDNIPNMDEVRAEYDTGAAADKGQATDRFIDFGLFGVAYLALAEEITKQKPLRCAGIDQVPFYCLNDGTTKGPKVEKVDWLYYADADSDGDSLRDDLDDVDHDDVANFTEYMAELATPFLARTYQHLDACIPNNTSRFCLAGVDNIDIDNDGLANGDDPDDDGDRLEDEIERKIGTDQLVWDTDSDNVADSFEYYSALDLNSLALPYPGKKPYPNPLDGDDAKYDFDGDGLPLIAEYKAWAYTGFPIPLSYSDGDQWTGPGKPARDDQRDVDNDGASNWTEFSGPLSGPTWWDKFSAEKPNRCTDKYVESTYPGPPYEGLNFVDPDTDGDGLKDGADDIDHDGLTNLQEAGRGQNWCNTYVSNLHKQGTDPLARVQPFNPCKPIYSDACHTHPPFGYYKEDEDTGEYEDWDSPVFSVDDAADWTPVFP